MKTSTKIVYLFFIVLIVTLTSFLVYQGQWFALTGAVVGFIVVWMLSKREEKDDKREG